MVWTSSYNKITGIYFLKNMYITFNVISSFIKSTCTDLGGGLAEGSIQIFYNYIIKFQKYAPQQTLKKLSDPSRKNSLDAHMKEKSQGVKDPDSTVCTMSQWLIDIGIEPYRACPPWVPRVYPPGSYFSSPLGSGTAPAPLQQTMGSENMDVKLFNKDSSVHLINNIWGQNTSMIIAC